MSSGSRPSAASTARSKPSTRSEIRAAVRRTLHAFEDPPTRHLRRRVRFPPYRPGPRIAPGRLAEAGRAPPRPALAPPSSAARPCAAGPCSPARRAIGPPGRRTAPRGPSSDERRTLATPTSPLVSPAVCENTTIIRATPPPLTPNARTRAVSLRAGAAGPRPGVPRLPRPSGADRPRVAARRARHGWLRGRPAQEHRADPRVRSQRRRSRSDDRGVSQTAGLTGGEVGIAGGTALVGQKVLEALFGDQAVRSLVERANTDLQRRVSLLMTEEQARFWALLDPASPPSGQGAMLRDLAYTVETARIDAGAA